MTAQKIPPEPIALTLLTGFLGAGKTTLLNCLLSDPALADTVVVINEVGEIGIDHHLVEQVDGEVMLMASGCLCCVMRGDLLDTLEDLLRRRDNGRIAPFKRVLIETTGLADPAPVLHLVMSHPYLVLRYRLDGVITVVDGVNGAATLDAHLEALKQAAVADRLVLTKSDIAPAADVAALRERLKRLNPAAAILDAARGEVSATSVLGAGLYDPSGKLPDVARWLADAAVASEETDHDHDHSHPDARFRVFSLTAETAISAATLELFLDLLRSTHGPRLLRLKGIVCLADDPDRPLVLHVVQHVLHPLARLSGWPDADRRTRFVAVTCDLDPVAVRRLFAAFLEHPAVDSPDRAVLLENPLAPGGLR